MSRPTKSERIEKALAGFTARQMERRRRQILYQTHSQKQPAKITGYRPIMNPPSEEDLQLIELETKTRFPLGSTVKFSKTGINRHGHRQPDRHGRVVGYAYGGDFRLGFSALVNVCVHWDGIKKPSAGYYRENLELVV